MVAERLRREVRVTRGLRSDWQQLTPRQAQVAKLLRRGYTQTEVAKRLSLSVRTIEQHAFEIRRRRGLPASTRVAVLSRVARDEHDRLVLEGRLNHRPSAGLRFKVLSRDDFTCQYCGRKAPNVELHVDHILAWARGGASVESNLITSCSDCNQGKKDRALPDPVD